MQDAFPYVVAFAALALCAHYGSVVWRMRSLRLRADLDPTRIDANDVPAELRALLDAHARELEALGFEALGWMREAYRIDGVDQPSYVKLLHHSEPPAFALLTIAGAPSRARACEVLFQSLAEDGRKLATTAFAHHHEWLGLKKHTVVDARTVSCAEQWQRHQSELAAQEEFVARDISADELIAECADTTRRATEHMLASGVYTQCADGRLRFRRRAALRIATAAAKAESARRAALAAFEKQRRSEPGSGADATADASSEDVAAEVFAHRRRESLEQSRVTGWLPKLALFCGSVVVFALAFGLQMSATTLALLFGVLLFHELGHALAMKVFGYRDLQVLFIPFLGAVASGRKRDTRPQEEIVVLLAGPVPGIVVGSVILAAGWGAKAEWLADLATLLLIVNYLNLLPILPLDGGRIMNVVLFDRFPLLQLVFSGLSAAAVLLAGAATNDGVLRAFGLFLALALPMQWRQTQLLFGVRARLAALGPALGTPDPLPSIYAELRHPRFDAWKAETRYQLVTQLLTRLARPVAGPGLACAAVAGWLLVMTLPLGVIVYRPYTEMQDRLAQADGEYARSRAEWDAKLAAAKTPVERARVQLGAGELALSAGHYDDAAPRFDAAAALLHGQHERALEATLALRRAQLSVETQDEGAPAPERLQAEQRLLDRALDLRELEFGPESLEVAEVLESYPDERDTAALLRKLRLIGIYERARASDGAHVSSLLRAYESASLLRADAGDAERAEAALRRALEVADSVTGERRAALHASASATLAAFYLTSRRYADARALEPAEGDRCWLAYWSGALDEARACFTALRGAADRAAGTPVLLDLALVAQAAGDAAEAKRLLDEARQRVEGELGVPFAQYARGWLSAEAEADPDAARELGWVAREGQHRSAERGRVLEPLLGAM